MPKITIAGAGFGGLRTALDLSKLLPKSEITLINSDSSHCFYPDLYEIAASVLKSGKRVDFANLRRLVAVSLDKVCAKKRIRVIIDEVAAVDLPQNAITTQTNGKLDYDFLVLSLGSVTNYFGIEGAEGYSHPLKCAEDALNIRNDIEELVAGNTQPASVVIAGGGFTGVELAGELRSFLQRMAKTYHRKVGQIVILEGSSELLGGMPEWARQAAFKRLKKLGVEVKFNCPIKNVDREKIYSENEKIGYDYLIWTAGVRGCDLAGKIKGAGLTQKGQLPVRQDLSLENYPNVFALGDLAEVKAGTRFVPAAAWAAISEGKAVAKNIQSQVLGKNTHDFVLPASAFVVPLGGRFALTNAFGLQLQGFPAWVLKRLISLRYLISILPFSQALVIWMKGVKVFTENDG